VGKAREAPSAAEAGLSRIQAARIKTLEEELLAAASTIRGALARTRQRRAGHAAPRGRRAATCFCQPDASRLQSAPCAERDASLEEALREARELRADKAAWARKQKQLEAQVRQRAAGQPPGPRLAAGKQPGRPPGRFGAPLHERAAC
jgi:hypothetical protein